jgi:hypothetical protein
MKILLVSANLGGIDKPVTHDPQMLPADAHFSEYLFSEENFPLRPLSMTPRMQAKIPKLFAWKLLPGSDIYIWLDASFKITENAVSWLLDQLQGADFAMFRHPSRKTIALEAEHLSKRLSGRVMKAEYIRSRYKDELLDTQISDYKNDTSFVDNQLFAAGCFIYRPTNSVQELMYNWWWHITRYHINDQLSFPYVLSKSQVALNTIHANIYDNPFLIYIRGDR